MPSASASSIDCATGLAFASVAPEPMRAFRLRAFTSAKLRRRLMRCPLRIRCWLLLTTLNRGQQIRLPRVAGPGEPHRCGPGEIAAAETGAGSRVVVFTEVGLFGQRLGVEADTLGARLVAVA